ncbi:hypothetical protein HJC23_005392 [Cyclotella cryptica]|uniref:RecA family profile 1 domain-containing protein n=1 Tax=Cyclotella cryptica TaxID=29204 RepID=A0ABD3P6L7_9STRA|eukprot:CCRYP_018095-RA/>CCRYP_018095-RA protein AED:0.02 eAED:0.02 QI:348/1/1/1/0/0/2/399/433
MSTNDRLLSSLPASLFQDLIAQPRLIAIRAKETSNGGEDDIEKLRQQILRKLKNVDTIATVRDFLKLSPTTLLHILDPCLTYVECKRLINRIHQFCAIPSVTALKIMQQTNPGINAASFHGKLSTGLPTLDRQLHGGFPICSITEIVGRAGVGKTHLSQQLCVLAAISGQGGSIYIDTEKKMSVLRLKEIALERSNVLGVDGKRKRAAINSANERSPAEKVLENVTVHSLLSTRELLETLDQLEKEINHRNLEAEEPKHSGEIYGSLNNSCIQRLPVRLLIIDSIAAPIRRDYVMTSVPSNSPSPNAAIQRAATIFEIARKLKKLADDYHLAVVVVNQVGTGTSSRGGGSGQRNDTLDTTDGEFTGSLGTAWQYCISTRIALEHEGDAHRLHQVQNQTRKAVITKSLVSKKVDFKYELTMQGVRELFRETQTG